jgi:hypothetical protein
MVTDLDKIDQMSLYNYISTVLSKDDFNNFQIVAKKLGVNLKMNEPNAAGIITACICDDDYIEKFNDIDYVGMRKAISKLTSEIVRWTKEYKANPKTVWSTLTSYIDENMSINFDKLKNTEIINEII